MRHRLAITALLTLAVMLTGSAAWAETFQKDNVRISFAATFAPQALPRDRQAPLTINLDSSISTADGSQPPSLRSFEIALNNQGRISTQGLPTCTSGALQSTTTEAALARCRGALVGRGSFGAALAAGRTPIPTGGTILAFNARLHGKPAVLLHLYGTVPVQATFVLPMEIELRPSGQLGTVLATKIPVLAGGVGSITKVKLKIGRRYSFRGRQRSFLSASCPAPAGFSLAVFPFARGSFDFVNGTRIDTTLTRSCKVR